MHMQKQSLYRLLSIGLCAVLAAAAPLSIFAATTQQDLQQKVDSAQSQYAAASSALADAHEDTSAAKDELADLNAQSRQILAEAQSISAQITTLSDQIAQYQQQIADTQTSIDQKQADYDAHKEQFKQRLAAMQEMHDSGTISALSSVTNLYELLTFADVLQDISQKDKSDLDTLEQEHAALEDSKNQLLAAQQELENTKESLTAQQDALNQKQSELASSIQAADASLDAAQAAEKAQKAITAQSKAALDAAIAEQDAYVKSQLKATAASTASLSCGLNFMCPLSSYTYISTHFGDIDAYHSKPHGGIDLAAPAGTPIHASESGSVIVARGSSSYGNYVVIYHGTASDGHSYSTLYAHMTSYCVSAGQSVNRGDVIGYVGSTGDSTGNHLHLELWQGGTKINPLLYIPA